MAAKGRPGMSDQQARRGRWAHAQVVPRHKRRPRRAAPYGWSRAAGVRVPGGAVESLVHPPQAPRQYRVLTCLRLRRVRRGRSAAGPLSTQAG
jgi:hypothetical protein